MRHLCRSGMLALGLVVGSGSVAHALNLCFNPGTPSPYQTLAVAERFRMPHKGSCSSIAGFDLVRPGSLVAGTACLNSTGDTLRVAYHIYLSVLDFPNVTTDPHLVSMSLPYPSLQGGHGFVTVSLENTGGPFGVAHANPCIPPSPVIP